MAFLSKGAASSTRRSLVFPELAHEEPPAGLVHALEAVELREPLSPYSRFQISCIGLGLALIGYGLSLQGGYWAPLAGASLIFLPCMLVATAITGLLALKHRRSLK